MISVKSFVIERAVDFITILEDSQIVLLTLFSRALSRVSAFIDRIQELLSFAYM